MMNTSCLRPLVRDGDDDAIPVAEQFLSEGYAKPAGLLMLWVSTATLLFLVLAINLDSVLRLQFGGAKPFAIALAISAGQMILCFLLPRGWVLG